jgi:hypothetical protein
MLKKCNTVSVINQRAGAGVLKKLVFAEKIRLSDEIVTLS